MIRVIYLIIISPETSAQNDPSNHQNIPPRIKLESPVLPQMITRSLGATNLLLEYLPLADT